MCMRRFQMMRRVYSVWVDMEQSSINEVIVPGSKGVKMGNEKVVEGEVKRRMGERNRVLKEEIGVMGE